MYVNGWLCELEHDTTYRTQPDYLDPVDLGLGGFGAGETRRDLVYIDAWHRAVSAIEDPHIRENALGGPDTAERLRLVAQVRVLVGIGPDVTCGSPLPLRATGGGRLQVVLTPTPTPPAPCEPLAEGGYQGPENRLYRVEIHTGGPVGTATFKWSRDNGSVAQAVEHFDSPTRLTVASVGHDDYLRFRTGDFVEVSDDATDLAGAVGLLAQVTVDEATRELTLASAVPSSVATASGRHPKVRRWDGGDAQLTAASPVELEDGIKVQFSADTDDFRSGDYWIFAARVADGSLDPLVDTPTPPMGVRHAYCALAIITWRRTRNDVVVDKVEDCRLLFPPLTQLPPATGGGCECVACVTAESHASGSLTIDGAVKLAEQVGGGTICIGPGDYELQGPIVIDGARNVHLRGQGQQTRLRFTGRAADEAAVEFHNCCGCSLERVAVLFGSVGSGVLVDKCVDTAVRSCALLSRSDPKQDGLAGAGVLFVETALRTRITDNLVIAERGVASATSSEQVRPVAGFAEGLPLLLADTEIEGNRFLCASAGVFLLDSALFVVRSLTISRNQFDQGSLAGAVVQGIVGPNARVEIDDNSFETQGYGLALECGRARVSGNVFSTPPERAAAGRSLQAAILLFDSTGLGLNQDMLVIGNRFAGGRGHGLLVNGRARDVMVLNNRFVQLGGAGIITGRGGSVQALTVANNDFSDLALDAVNFPEGVAGAIVLNLASDSRLLGNTIARVGSRLDGLRVVGIALLGSSHVLISENILDDIGGSPNGLPGAGIEASGVVSELSVAHNSVRRTSAVVPEAAATPWSALRIASARTNAQPGKGSSGQNFFTLGASAFTVVQARASGTPPPDEPQFEPTTVARQRVLMIAPPSQAADQFAARTIVVDAIVLARSAATVADNAFDSSASAPVVDVQGMSELVFSGNRCHLSSRETSAAVRLGASRVMIVGNNAVDGSNYATSIEVLPTPEGLTVVGNVVRQPMSGVPATWTALNVSIP